MFSDTATPHRHKYENKNPVQRFVLGRFFDAIVKEIREINPERVLDFGTGEGYFLEELGKRGFTFKSLVGLDLREDALNRARSIYPSYEFIKVDLFNWKIERGSFDLVVASEVLEHLNDPGRFLERLSDLSRGHLLLTVPFEPWFRLMNLLRGRNIRRLGNHPEHINRWGYGEFKKFVTKYVRTCKSYVIFPFIIVVAKPLENGR
jgi:2-polyprenyl-3-methyl-5-hydroxy-6-metoxy-1,4-benzoquinol methylase